MTNAYDLNDLVNRLKPHGLDLAEDAAKGLVKEVLAWVKDSALQSENKFDDLTLVVIPMVEEYILKQVDKIDGAEG